MNEIFISNFRKIIEQNLQIYKNSPSKLRGGRESVDNIISITQKQLIVLKPIVLLSRYEPAQAEGPDSSIQSTHSEFMGFPDNDDSRMFDVEVEFCNQGNMASNIREIRSIIETEDHEIPFIDVHSPTVDKLMLLTKEKENEEEKHVDNPKNRKGKKRRELVSTKQQTPRSSALVKSTPTLQQSSEEVLSYNLLSLGNLESEIVPQSEPIGSKNVNCEEKNEIKKSLRTRKPVMSASYYDAVEPSPKKKKKSRQAFSSTSTFDVSRDFLKIDALPQSATVSEVHINFPISLPLQDGKYRICIDLDKVNLPRETFRTITKTPQKRRTKSTTKNNSNESAPVEKSDLVKYLEIFSSDCENQNFDISACGSPVNNNNSAIATINFEDQTSGPQIGDIVILQPNQNCNESPKVGNVISMDSSGVIIDESAKQLISYQLDKDAELAEPAVINGLNTSSNASVGLNTTSGPAASAAPIDGTQMDDFEFPLDIDNSVYRLYEYIENGGEIFNQTNTNQQPSQSVNIVRTASSTSINNINNTQIKSTTQQSIINNIPTKPTTQQSNIYNTPTKPTIYQININNATTKSTAQQSDINRKDTKESFRKRHHTTQIDMMAVPAAKSSTLPEFYENRNQAHSHKNAPRRRNTLLCEEVLDLSAQKAKGSRSDSVMDLTVSSSYHDFPNKEQEKVTTFPKHSIDLSRSASQTLDNAHSQRISLEEYQRRNATIAKTVSQSLPENTTKKKKDPKPCGKNCVSCEENRTLNNPLEYEFDEHSNNFELQCVPANKAGPSYNFADQSPATKDSGIDSEDCGSKSTGNNSSVSVRGDSTPVYKSREEESLEFCHEVDDDALSIFINSAAGSPFYFSENNEADAEDEDGCEKSVDEITTPPPPKISRDIDETPTHDGTTDTMLRVIADGSCGSKKVFKIPKLMNPTLKTTNTIRDTSVLNDLESNFLFSECSTNQNTKSDFCTKPENLIYSGQALVQQFEKNFHSRKDVIGHIFGNRPCFMYLEGNCQKPNCKFSHEIIDCNTLRLRLLKVSNTTLNSGYFFISRNKNLFRLYFSAFCDTFSQRGDRKRLVGMIRDCQLYQDTAYLLKLIVAGFVKNGMSQVDAIRVIIENLISSKTEAMDILVDLMIDSDVTQFVSTLESYVSNPRYKFKMEAIDKLALKCNRTKHFDVIQLLLKIILFQLPKQEVKNLQSAELVKFLDMVRNSHMTNTVQNVYDSCMNTNNQPETMLDEHFPPTARTSSSKTILPSMPSLTPLPSSLTSSLLNNFTKRP